MRACKPGHIRLGVTERGPLDLPVETLHEKHWAVIGPIGQRKTLFLVSQFLQYLKLANHVVVLVDLGGDQPAYWLLRKAAKAAGKPFFFFRSTRTTTRAVGTRY